MNFWHMQLHPSDITWRREKNLLIERGVIGLGDWEEEKANQQIAFEKQMKIGDIVAVKRGGNLIALTRVIGDYEYINDDEDFEWCKRRRKIEILDWYDKSYTFYVAANKTLTRCADENTPTTISIKKWYKQVIENQNKVKILELIKFKHQIILQGPPGTGKTRLAKLIAEDMIKPKVLGHPEEIIDRELKKFDSTNDHLQVTRKHHQRLRNDFLEQFPKERLNQLTLDKYCIGTGEENNFCWWIELGLEPLGSYFPGTSRTYQIYWKKKSQEYSKHGIVKNIIDDDEAMDVVANQLHSLVNKKMIEEASKKFGDSFILKILNTYYPDEYFPINSKDMLNHALKIFKVDYTELSPFEKNKKLYEIYLNKKTKFNLDITAFEFSNILSTNFNLKTGEDISEKNEVISQGEYQIIQFHPAYSYEDFVRGIVAETDDNGNISYNVENKVLADFAKKAQEDPNGKYVLIIDEINRANLPSVLGELIYALEYRGEPVVSMYEYGNSGREIILPKNLYIIGTMNTADRSVGHIDYAIRRRFAFVDVQPNETIIENQKAKSLFKDVDSLFKEHISPDFQKDDVMIGHSYFLVQDDNKLKIKLDYEIKPILKEYLKDGILLESASEKIEKLKV